MSAMDFDIWMYRPNPNLMQAKPDMEYCRVRVSQPHRWGSRQCLRKAVETVAGYGCCKIHAKRLRLVAARLKVSGEIPPNGDAGK